MSPTCGLPDRRYYEYDWDIGGALSAATATNDKLRAKIAKLRAAGETLDDLCRELEIPYPEIPYEELAAAHKAWEQVWQEAKK